MYISLHLWTCTEHSLISDLNFLGKLSSPHAGTRWYYSDVDAQRILLQIQLIFFFFCHTDTAQCALRHIAKHIGPPMMTNYALRFCEPSPVNCFVVGSSLFKRQIQKSTQAINRRAEWTKMLNWRRLFNKQCLFIDDNFHGICFWAHCSALHGSAHYQSKCVQCINELWSRVCNFHLAPQHNTQYAPLYMAGGWVATHRTGCRRAYTHTSCLWLTANTYLLVFGWVEWHQPPRTDQMCVGIFTSIRMRSAMCSHVFEKQNSTRTIPITPSARCIENIPNGKHYVYALS